MKTVDELWQECIKASQACEQCKERLRRKISRNPEYLRFSATCRAAFLAYEKAKEAEREKQHENC